MASHCTYNLSLAAPVESLSPPEKPSTFAWLLAQAQAHWVWSCNAQPCLEQLLVGCVHHGFSIESSWGNQGWIKVHLPDVFISDSLRAWILTFFGINIYLHGEGWAIQNSASAGYAQSGVCVCFTGSYSLWSIYHFLVIENISLNRLAEGKKIFSWPVKHPWEPDLGQENVSLNRLRTKREKTLWREEDIFLNRKCLTDQ